MMTESEISQWTHSICGTVYASCCCVWLTGRLHCVIEVLAQAFSKSTPAWGMFP